METLERRAKILRIQTDHGWPSTLPAVSWRGWRIAGESDSNAVDFSASPLGAVIKTCYPTLGLTGIAQALDAFPEHAEEITAAFGLRWNDRLERLLHRLRQTPSGFQSWTEARKLSARDLLPLLAIEQIGDFASVLEKLSASSATRSEGTQALEWAVDLFLMGHAPSTIPMGGPDWMAKLRQLRRPMEAADRERRKTMQRWPWPAQTSGEWQLTSDQPALHIDLQATSPDDLEKKLRSLESIVTAWRRWEGRA